MSDARSYIDLPESYQFECRDETTLRIFRYPDSYKILFTNVYYHQELIDEKSIDLKGKRIEIHIGEILPSKKKLRKHWGTLTNYAEDVSIEIGYENKQFQELVLSLESNQNLKKIFIGLEIKEKEAKKEVTDDMTTYMVDNFKIVKLLK